MSFWSRDDAPWDLNKGRRSKKEQKELADKLPTPKASWHFGPQEHEQKPAEDIYKFIERHTRELEELDRGHEYKWLTREETRRRAEQQALEYQQQHAAEAESKVSALEEASQLIEEFTETNKGLSQAVDDLIKQRSEALKIAIKAIHDIEEDDSYDSEDLLMTISYLAALQDPQDR